MTGLQLTGAGIGFALFGIIGAISMASTAADPVSRAEDGLASAIGGIVFFVLVAGLSIWAIRLGLRRTARLAAAREYESDVSE